MQLMSGDFLVHFTEVSQLGNKEAGSFFSLAEFFSFNGVFPQISRKDFKVYLALVSVQWSISLL